MMREEDTNEGEGDGDVDDFEDSASHPSKSLSTPMQHILLGLVQTAESLRLPFPQVWPSNSFAVPGAASATKRKTCVCGEPREWQGKIANVSTVLWFSRFGANNLRKTPLRTWQRIQCQIIQHIRVSYCPAGHSGQSGVGQRGQSQWRSEWHPTEAWDVHWLHQWSLYLFILEYMGFLWFPKSNLGLRSHFSAAKIHFVEVL